MASVGAFVTAPLVRYEARNARHATLHGLRAPRMSAREVPRRTMLQSAALSLLCVPARALAEATSNAHVTDTVYLDLKIAGSPAGRLIIGLYGDDAPASVQTFKSAISPGIRGRAGLVVSYRNSYASRVNARFVELGRVKQIDEINQSPGTAQRQPRIVTPPENRESNTLTHDARGLLSVKRGGGVFEFALTFDEAHALDDSNIVVGKLLQGDEVLSRLARVPTNRKTIRDGFRNVGKVIGDARAKVDLEEKPLQKVVIADCGFL